MKENFSVIVPEDSTYLMDDILRTTSPVSLHPDWILDKGFVTAYDQDKAQHLLQPIAFIEGHSSRIRSVLPITKLTKYMSTEKDEHIF